MEAEFLRNLPKVYEHKEVEEKWRKLWEEAGIYRFDKLTPQKRLFSVDTPPPTVSGDLHIGHVFSYTHQDFIVRYKRMQGFEVFYPFGYDDNGLPTERLVEKVTGVKAAEVPREKFIELCLKISKEQEERFRDLWQAVGLSCDWEEIYATIDEVSRRISQRSFLDLLKKGEVYRKEAPTLWCPECKTAIAQAEIEDKAEETEFHDIVFETEDGKGVVIATTRPELLPACVAVFFHPDDNRYSQLKGRYLLTPCFRHRVKVYEDMQVDPEKGTGIVMCCTFGDTTDIDWWQKYQLATKIVIDETGRLNELAGEFQGLKLKEARKAILDKLKEQGKLLKSQSLEHTVSVHERCGTPLEYLVNKQWFVKVLDKKEQLIEFGEKCQWYPSFMKVRYRHWVENLKWDWCISRQRYFGVPFPLWYCADCDEVIPADEDQLPVNPLTDKPPKDSCPNCGSRNIYGEKDVLDTWATSSLTPQINARWGEHDDRMDQLFPMDLRPQAHDIIRTWAFYTITKAYLHHGTIPWRRVMISGHALDSSRTKISKSKMKTANPKEIIEQYSADVVRWWAGQSKLGADTFIDLSNPHKTFSVGKRLLIKIYNASKFVCGHIHTFDAGQAKLREAIVYPVDSWICGRLAETIEKATRAFEEFEFSDALKETERFFWHDFCDNYLELVKWRLYGEKDEELDEHERTRLKESAKTTLHIVMENVLKLFAPFLPYITEEIWHWHFSKFTKLVSIHLTQWPKPDELSSFYDEEKMKIGNDLIEALALARKAKSELNISIRKQAKMITYGFATKEAVDSKVKGRLLKVEKDLLATANVDEMRFIDDVLEQGVELERPRLRAYLKMQ